MEWRADAIRRQKVRGTGGGFKQEEQSTEAAYVCLLGHASDKCPACGSRDTVRAENGSKVKCNACGKLSPLADGD